MLSYISLKVYTNFGTLPMDRDYLYGLSRLSARSVRSMSAAGTRSPPRRAQNLLAGCIFVGIADKSAFALLSGK